MLTISTRQMHILSEDLRFRNRNRCRDFILLRLQEFAPETMKPFTQKQQENDVSRVLEAGERIGLTNMEHLLNWSYIRFLSGLEFFEMVEFADVLGHPVLHPDAKGRHIVLAYFAIQRARTGRLK